MTRLLKEWDVVGRALQDGRQILLARKGGILDDDGLFVPAFGEFFLYPTYLHESEQAREALKPEELARYGDLLRNAATTPPDTVSVRVFARVVETHTVADAAALKRLEPQHIWNPGFLEKRFAWGSTKGLTLLVVRAYVLDPPATIDVEPSFAGCRSWIETEKKIDRSRMKPALSEEDFEIKRRTLRKALSGE